MRAEDVVAIQQLMARYGHVADGDGSERWEDVFHPEAILDMRALGGEIHHGIEEIRAFFALGAPPHPPSHHSTNVLVTGEGDVARVRSKWMTVDRDSGGLKTGDYADTVVRGEAGWRIRERVATPRWYPAAL